MGSLCSAAEVLYCFRRVSMKARPEESAGSSEFCQHCFIDAFTSAGIPLGVPTILVVFWGRIS